MIISWRAFAPLRDRLAPFKLTVPEIRTVLDAPVPEYGSKRTFTKTFTKAACFLTKTYVA